MKCLPLQYFFDKEKNKKKESSSSYGVARVVKLFSEKFFVFQIVL
jgi:hypothetical protein